MSVVVRMEMPKRCDSCDFWHVCKNVADFGAARYFEEPRELFVGMKGCMIVCQLPEGHGRLVDADAYSAEMKDRQDAAWKWRNEAIEEEDEVKLARAEGAFTAFVEAKLTWDEQVTIVPAERSET